MDTEVLFELGEIVVTPKVLQMIRHAVSIFLLNCHAYGKRGDISGADWKLNDWAISHWERLVSSHSEIWQKRCVYCNRKGSEYHNGATVGGIPRIANNHELENESIQKNKKKL
ncbi:MULTISPECIES: hypothetical protein [Paenibacillus]|uniref:hypothetical protein n=1 Tax=Paenibacillus TaxID=44249 RepID=UPI00096D6DC2|nr:hypothetical protein [Paenibacillus odorifer]OME12362.1 hypothetical protein BSK60_18550 [Paenibacillus odorifer]